MLLLIIKKHYFLQEVIRMKIIKRTIHILRINLKEILLFEILYRLAAGILFFSLFTRGMSLAIKVSGYSYLTTKNIGLFLLRPFTILALLVVLGIGVVLLVIEFASLLAVFQAGERCEKLPAHQIFIRGIKICRFYFRNGNLPSIGMNIVLMLVFQLVLLSKGVSHIKPISDLVKNIGQSVWGSALVLLFVLMVIFLFLPGLFTIHFELLNNKTGKEAWKESWHLVSRHTFSATCSILCLNVALYLIFRLVLILCAVFATLIIYHFVSKSIALALLLTTYGWMEIVILLVASILNSMYNTAFLTGLYYTYRDMEGMAPELLVLEEKKKDKKAIKTRNILLAVCALFFCVILYDVVENGIRFAKEAFVETSITAHRGSSVEAPENTLPAIELAIEQMADYVEIDVQESKDGELILLHDKSFRRTCGVNSSPRDMTLLEIKQLNAAFYMEGYKSTEVPTLNEVLELCKDKIYLNIELKSNGNNGNLPEKTVELVKEYNMEKQCVFTSTNLVFLKKIKELNKELKTGYILSNAIGEFYKNDAVDFFSLNSALVNEHNMALIHEKGQEVHAWTVNSRAEMERLKFLGVDNIITDYPVLAREILYREEDTENFLEFLTEVLK